MQDNSHTNWLHGHPAESSILLYVHDIFHLEVQDEADPQNCRLWMDEPQWMQQFYFSLAEERTLHLGYALMKPSVSMYFNQYSMPCQGGGSFEEESCDCWKVQTWCLLC